MKTLAQQLRDVATQLEMPVTPDDPSALKAKCSWLADALADSERNLAEALAGGRAFVAENEQLRSDLEATRETLRRTELVWRDEERLRAALKQDFKELQRFCTDVQAERDSLAESCEARLREINALRTQLQLAEEKCDRLQSSYDDMVTSHDAAAAGTDEFAALKGELETLQDEYNRIAGERNDIQCRANAAYVERDKWHAAHARATNLLDDALREKEILTAERDALRTAHDDQAAEIQRLNAIIGTVMSTISEA